ncbi:hypothetical protein QJS10_CPA08g00969 [Acorus calamus]|uniref:Uncharacterized protein n=1 Tax=Acorus calamus TaxID=4465 RepID=A0AAV9E9W6_ACOCL|nr:hypothetical protein QJS10_CPA08g00969 [Acorus calamus]
MVETLCAPSELHLKKELTALRKARFLRDPETCSSWRSPSSRPENAGRRRSSSIRSNSGGEIDPGLSQKTENGRKKVLLHNWSHHSIKSSSSGTKLDGRVSVFGSPKVSLSNGQNLEDHEMVYGVRNINSETSTRRMARKVRKRTSVKRVNRSSTNSRVQDLPSSSLRTHNSNDDREYCDSEDIRLSSDNNTGGKGMRASSVTPMQTRVLENARMDDSSYSCTPASTGSYGRYLDRNPSTIGSWDGTAASFGGDEMDQLQLSRRQGCGIPCYWSRRTKSKSSGGYYSPSFSDTLRIKGSSILCGSQSLYYKRRSSPSYKQKFLSNVSQGSPLLNNGCNGGGSVMDSPSDGIAANLGELDLEALSRLDGRRWSSCRSQDALESAVDERADDMMPDYRSLSIKYRPRSFDDIVGQNIVVQSLVNSLSRGRIAPAYLFQGPRGTGKTCTARVFAAALNCMSSEGIKPCQSCRECTNFASGNSTNMKEVEAANKKGMGRVRYLLKNLSAVPAFSRYKIFVVNECHMLSSKTWLELLKFLEDSPSRIVFIFISTDPNNVPRAVVSRCQKYLFPKIKDGDIVSKLRKISIEENLNIELDALDLIAMNSDGSLRDAETVLDQLSLLGKSITTTMVNDLIGIVSDEKLLDLLEIALSSDTAETVKRSRELMNSGVDPMALMSQLASLIMDIIAGTYQLVNSNCAGSSFSGRSLTEAELAKLQEALNVLSEAEKQLRHSSERSTWFTAALLQLCSNQMPEFTPSSQGSRPNTQEVKKESTNRGQSDGASGMSDSLSTNQKSVSGPRVGVTNECASPPCDPSSSKPMRVDQSHNAYPKICQSLGVYTSTDQNEDSQMDKNAYKCATPVKLEEIWRECIARCHSTTLRQFLYTNGKLVSVTEVEGVLVAFIAFNDGDAKSRAERYLSSITNSIELVLRHSVEVRIGVMPVTMSNTVPNYSTKQIEASMAMDEVFSISCSSNDEPNKESPTLPRKSFTGSRDKAKTIHDTRGNLRLGGATFPLEGYNESLDMMSLQRASPAVDEKKLESAWIQVAEKGTPKSVSRFKPERNQVSPQDGIVSSTALVISSKNWEEVNQEIKALKIDDRWDQWEEQSRGRTVHRPMSPSFLHSNSFTINLDNENLLSNNIDMGAFNCVAVQKANETGLSQ